MEYKEDEFLMLSGIQHFSFCRRQWALIHVENQWEENVRTIEGEFIHEKVHDQFSREQRNEKLSSRGMPVRSVKLGISGECDLVEFTKSAEGIPVRGLEERYLVTPVEYKRGKEKETDADLLQLAAQAMCLEEMLCCEIKMGFLYYNETRKRIEVAIDDELRKKVEMVTLEMHSYMQRGYTPKVKPQKGCRNCSLKEVCMPELVDKKSAAAYMDRMLDLARNGGES